MLGGLSFSEFQTSLECKKKYLLAVIQLYTYYGIRNQRNTHQPFIKMIKNGIKSCRSQGYLSSTGLTSVLYIDSSEAEPGGTRWATGPSNIWQIFPLLLTVCTAVKSKGNISQNLEAFSEYMNFNQGGHIMPTNYHWPPKSFSPSSITGQSPAHKVFLHIVKESLDLRGYSTTKWTKFQQILIHYPLE